MTKRYIDGLPLPANTFSPAIQPRETRNCCKELMGDIEKPDFIFEEERLGKLFVNKTLEDTTIVKNRNKTLYINEQL